MNSQILMPFLTVFIIITLVFLTFFRAFINAGIWNNLHGKNGKLFVNASSIDEVDDSSESALFGIYCCLIFVWFRFKKEMRMKVLYSTLMSLATLVLLYFLFEL